MRAPRRCRAHPGLDPLLPSGSAHHRALLIGTGAGRQGLSSSGSPVVVVVWGVPTGTGSCFTTCQPPSPPCPKSQPAVRRAGAVTPSEWYDVMSHSDLSGHRHSHRRSGISCFQIADTNCHHFSSHQDRLVTSDQDDNAATAEKKSKDYQHFSTHQPR